MIQYPTYRVPSAPTPNTLLVVCEKCHKASWTFRAIGHVNFCCKARQREATPVEYKHAKTILGE